MTKTESLKAQKAIFSPCRRYRYSLWREWGRMDSKNDLVVEMALGMAGRFFSFEDRYVQFIGLNPSTADETKNDATIRRCIGFAKAWGYGGLVMTNAFAWRDTDPRKMKAQAEPIGEENDAWLVEVARNAGLTVAAWGTHGTFIGRDKQIIDLFGRNALKLHCFRKTKHGHPEHPLYMPEDTQPITFP